MFPTDSVSPEITCPPNVNAFSNPITWPDPTVTDMIDTSPQFQCDRMSGDSFGNGQTTVTCTATDAAGNSAMCTFIVSLGM